MQPKSRIVELDLLRGLAIFAMIMIHTCYYFLNNPVALFFWNYDQFAVPVFVFCSCFLFFRKFDSRSFSWRAYIQKRYLRLLLPFYTFLIFFVPIQYVIKPERITPAYLLQSVTLIGGVDINWLVLLFLQLTIVFPVIALFYEKQRKLFYGATIIVLLSSLLFTFYHLPFSYKWIMWLSWAGIPLYTLVFQRFKASSLFIGVSAFIAFFVLLVMLGIEQHTHHAIGMYENKYPPTLYFLAFGVLSTALLYRFAQFNFLNTPVNGLLFFLSKYSYSIYFVHYLILTIGVSLLDNLHFTWYTFFLAVFLPTIIVQYSLNHLRKRISLHGKPVHS